ncbi:MAG: RNB domain-containing ribonuclease [Oligoflexales bacterium]|nr:RNB domain-containing ribonuclease [Oligoflexales bacterium]
MRTQRTMILNIILTFSLFYGGACLAITKQAKTLMTLGLMVSNGSSYLPQKFSSSPAFRRGLSRSFEHSSRRAPAGLQIHGWGLDQSQRHLLAPLSSLADRNHELGKHVLDIPKNELEREFLQHAISQEAKALYEQQTLEEVEELARRPIDFLGLEDFTDLDFVTIDNDHSKDLDQAVYINFDETSETYRVYYAIADASYFSVPGTSLDKEASERVFTSYLPGFDIPVFPRVISEDLCSLSPNQKRRAVVIMMDFSAEGTMVSKSFAHAAIISRAQLSYRTVQEYYGKGHGHDYAKKPFHTTLDYLYTLGEALVQKAKDRGVVDYAFREMSIHPDGELGLYSVSENTRYEVEKYNEQISVASNRAVAEYFKEHSLHSIHRYHPSTTNERIEIAKSKLEKLGMPWNDGEDMRGFIESICADELVGEIAKSIAWRSNLKAKYSARSDQRGHEGLKVGSYDHFTAPMRRYTDIINHRILLASIKGDAVPYQSNSKKLPRYLRKEYLERYVRRANGARYREENIKRSIDDYVSSLLLIAVKDETLKATVMYVNDKGMSIHIDGHPFDRWLRSNMVPKGMHLDNFREGERIDITLEEAYTDDQWSLNPKLVSSGL